jgi:hypothetical protein
MERRREWASGRAGEWESARGGVDKPQSETAVGGGERNGTADCLRPQAKPQRSASDDLDEADWKRNAPCLSLPSLSF